MNGYCIVILILLKSFSSLTAQEVEVLTLATFHFAFYNNDVKKTDEKDQIDVLNPKYQNEIKSIVEKLEKFKPTIIVIERRLEYQEKYDSIYTDYLKGKHELTRDEEQQIGFRLAKRLGLKQLYCTDTWGADYEDITQLLEGTDSIAKQKFMNFFYDHPDSLLVYEDENLYKTNGILTELRKRNSENFLKQNLGNYLIGIFKYETEGNKYFGTDFTTGWWYNRNLRIFRNIQKIPTKPNDKILVIYGSDHMNILNTLFEASPEYTLVSTNEFLK